MGEILWWGEMQITGFLKERYCTNVGSIKQGLARGKRYSSSHVWVRGAGHGTTVTNAPLLYTRAPIVPKTHASEELPCYPCL